MEKMQDLTALLKHEVEDLISAEDQIIEALPMMIEGTSNNELKKALREHLKVTENQRRRLDKVQQLLGEDNDNNGGGFLSKLFGGGKHECKGMKGIIEEGNKMLAADMDQAVKDAAIIASCQKVEHYEICGYGTAKAYARELSRADVAKLLEETLDEEYEADRLLTTLAEGDINEKAEGKGRTSKAAASKSSGATGGSKMNGSRNGSAKKSAASKGTATASKGSNSSKGATTTSKSASKASPKKAATKTASKSAGKGKK